MIQKRPFLLIFVLCLLSIQGQAAVIVPEEKPNEQTVFYEGHSVGDLSHHMTSYEDTLVELAVKKGVGYVELLAANPNIDPWLPGKNNKITIPDHHLLPSAPREGVLINLGEMRLYYFPPDGSAPMTRPIGIGRDGLSTPLGETFIRTKVKGPKWRPTPRMRQENPDLPAVVEAGEDNPLGSHALYLNWPAYLIHGTHKPTGIGRRVSSGCIRMYPDDVKWLYETVATQTKVTVIDEPIKTAWIDDQFFIEAQPDSQQVDEIEYHTIIQTPAVSNKALHDLRKTLGKKAKEIDWSLVRRVLLERSGLPINVMKKQEKEKRASTETTFVSDTASRL